MAASTSFLRAFLVSAAGTGASRVLGALRDMAAAAALGASAQSDAFWIAFTIPNVMRRFVADEGLSGALVPALARAESEEGVEAARRLADQLAGLLLVLNVVLVALGIVFAEPAVLAFAWSYKDDPAQLALTTQMTRWLFPFLACVSAVSFYEGLLNYRGHYFIPKVAPGVVNVAMAIGVTWCGGWFDEPVLALVGGVLVGGVLHVLMHVPTARRLWGPIRFSFDFRSPRAQQVMRQLGLVVLIGVFAPINLVVLRQISAALGPGEVTRFWYANRVVDLSQGIIAVAIGSALLPPVSAAVVNNDMKALEAALVRALSLAGFLLLPACAVLLTFSVPMVSMLFRYGAFTAEDVERTAAVVRLLVPFLLAVAGINLLKRVFFALDDRAPLLGIGLFGVVVTAALGFGLAGPFGLEGLAAGLSIATVLQWGAYGVVLRRRLGPHLGARQVAARWSVMAAAMLPGTLWMGWLAQGGTWLEAPLAVENLARFGVGLFGAAVAYLGIAAALGVEELRLVLARVRRR